MPTVGQARYAEDPAKESDLQNLLSRARHQMMRLHELHARVSSAVDRLRGTGELGASLAAVQKAPKGLVPEFSEVMEDFENTVSSFEERVIALEQHV